MNPRDNKEQSETSIPAISDRYEYISAKSQKLASALYLVTNFLSDSEPLKWKLRQQVLGLAGDFASSQRAAVFYKLSLLERAIKTCDEVSALLDIARNLGVVSEMNLAVLQREYVSLKGQLEELAGSRQIERQLFVSEPLKPERQLEAVNHPKTTSEVSAVIQPTATARRPVALPRKNLEESDQKNGRKQRIIGFLGDKNWTSIKDIAAAVPDCSQKTVQRELSDLVEQGVLKKRGDRRWSRYVLARP